MIKTMTFSASTPFEMDKYINYPDTTPYDIPSDVPDYDCDGSETPTLPDFTHKLYQPQPISLIPNLLLDCGKAELVHSPISRRTDSFGSCFSDFSRSETLFDEEVPSENDYTGLVGGCRNKITCHRHSYMEKSHIARSASLDELVNELRHSEDVERQRRFSAVGYQDHQHLEPLPKRKSTEALAGLGIKRSCGVLSVQQLIEPQISQKEREDQEALAAHVSRKLSRYVVAGSNYSLGITHETCETFTSDWVHLDKIRLEEIKYRFARTNFQKG